MMKDRANITVAILCKVIFGLFIGIFTFVLGPFESSSPVLAHFDCKYFGNGDVYIKYYYCHHLESHGSALNSNLHLTLTHSKGQVKVMHIAIENIS